MRTRLIMVTALLAVFTAPALADIAVPAIVEGTLNVDERTTPLTHGYAKYEVKLKEIALDENQLESIQIVLVDRELPANAALADGPKHMLAMDGKLRGIVLTINMPKGELAHGRLLLPEAEKPISFSIIGSSEAYVLEGFTFTDNIAEGRVRTAAPESFPEFGGADGPKTYAFAASFRIPVRPAAAVTQTLTGEAAKNSEPAKLAIAVEQAMRKKDAARMRSMMRPDDPMLAILDTPEGKRVMAMMASMSLDAKARRAAINKVVFMGDQAVVVSKVKGGWDAVHMAKVGDAWKLSSD
jgi:hypothetical protein